MVIGSPTNPMSRAGLRSTCGRFIPVAVGPSRTPWGNGRFQPEEEWNRAGAPMARNCVIWLPIVSFGYLPIADHTPTEFLESEIQTVARKPVQRCIAGATVTGAMADTLRLRRDSSRQVAAPS